MPRLQKLVKRFLARKIGLEDVQRSFAVLLEEDSNLAVQAAAWLDAGEQDGRLSSAVCTSLKNVIVSHLAANAEGPDPRESGIFEVSAEFRESRTGSHGDKQTPPSTKLPETQIATADETTHGTEPIVRNLENRASEQTLRASVSVDAVLKIGSVVGERYELLEQLGSGGMGTVYKARDRLRVEAQDRNPFVALKVLSEEFKEHPDSMIALQREARRAQTLAHPNVITVHEFFRDGPHFYMTMELLDGHPLDELLRSELAGGLPLDEAWPIIESVGQGLQYGHENGIVHSDVKPGNIFVCKDSTVKVLDFGISRPIPLVDVPDSEQTRFDPRERLGTLTPGYASLEMWNQEPPDPRDDIYSLACVTYLLLRGRHPFECHTAKSAYKENLEPEKLPGVTRVQWKTIAHGLQFRRRERIKSVRRFLRLLAPSYAIRARRRLAALIGVLILVAAAGVAVWIYGVVVENRVFTDLTRMPGADSAAPREPVVVTPQQQEEIDGLIELARFELAAIDVNASAAELSYILSDGTNNVVQLADAVLDINPGDKVALTLRQDAFDLYVQKANQFIALGNYESALQMSRDAEAITPDTRNVLQLQRIICNRAPKLCER